MDGASSARGHGADAVVDGVIFHRGLERNRGRVAFARAGRNAHRDRVVVNRDRGNRGAVFVSRIVDAPILGVRLPDIPGVIADDIAIDALHTLGGDDTWYVWEPY